MQTNNKLRETLKGIANNLENRLFGRYSCSATDEWMWQKARDALAEPVRNCEVGTTEEQDERFKNFCLSYYEPCNVDGECWKCPLFKTKTRCPIAWAQLPYDEEKEINR